MMTTIDDAIEAVYTPNVGVVGKGSFRHERPHKPVLLFAVLDSLAQGEATPSRIDWSQRLRERFALYFEVVRSLNDQCTPENPFLYLRQEGWWQPLRQGSVGPEALETTPTVADTSSHSVFARLTDGFDTFVARPHDRVRLRLALVSRYFAKTRETLVPLFAEGAEATIVTAASKPEQPVRSGNRTQLRLPAQSSRSV